MTDTVLQHVLSDLRPQSDLSFQGFSISFDNHDCSILFKLKAEADQLTGGVKKATVDTHRGGMGLYSFFFSLSEDAFAMQIPISFATLFEK